MYVIQHCSNFILLISTSLFIVQIPFSCTSAIKVLLMLTELTGSHQQRATGETWGAFYWEEITGSAMYLSQRLALTAIISTNNIIFCSGSVLNIAGAATASWSCKAEKLHVTGCTPPNHSATLPTTLTVPCCCFQNYLCHVQLEITIAHGMMMEEWSLTDFYIKTMHFNHLFSCTINGYASCSSVIHWPPEFWIPRINHNQ